MRSEKLFQGVCLDTEAQEIVVGKRQARAYCKHHNLNSSWNPQTQHFCFDMENFYHLDLWKYEYLRQSAYFYNPQWALYQ